MSDEPDASGVDMTTWQEFPWQRDEPDVARDRLCTGGDHGTPLDCRVEGDDLTVAPAQAKDELVAWAYNVERGLRLDDQLETFAALDPSLAPDILLISEADRGCSRTDGRNVAREYARALGMYYVFGVEFVELPRFWGPGGGRIRRTCEHGNAIVSRYPLGNVRAIRHTEARSWNSPLQRTLRLGQPRLGGRVAVTADVRVGERLLRVYCVHFESGVLPSSTAKRSMYREAQAAELIADAADVPHGVLIGGDMNVVEYRPSSDGRSADPTVESLAAAGYADTHATLPATERATHRFGKILDLITSRDVTVLDAGVGAADTWGGLSDHLPIWARIDLRA